MDPFDLIILGGGISGLGVAREASRRKLRTALLESGRCASATSDNTLRIIHGGFRYLQNFDFPRVIKSLGDQKAVLRDAPDAVAPLPCVMPLQRFGLKSRLPVTCAALLYRCIMRLCGSPLPRPRVMSASEVHREIPLLRGLAPHGALLWHDAVMLEPSKVTESLLREIAQGPVTILEGVKAASVAVADGLYEVRAQDGRAFQARSVVSTLGPFMSSVAVPEQLAGARPLWCKGFNITLSRQLEARYGVGIEGETGRLFFVVPRGSGSAIGTWYTAHPNDGSPVIPFDEEVEALISEFNAALPGANVHRSEVTGFDAGLLPMEGESASGPALVANTQIHAVGRYVEVLSTKYTTFRSQARQALAKASKGLV